LRFSRRLPFSPGSGTNGKTSRLKFEGDGQALLDACICRRGDRRRGAGIWRRSGRIGWIGEDTVFHLTRFHGDLGELRHVHASVSNAAQGTRHTGSRTPQTVSSHRRVASPQEAWPGGTLFEPVSAKEKSLPFKPRGLMLSRPVGK